MAQPQISYIIRSVEEEVGFPLFYRTRSGVTATPQGSCVWSRCESSLEK